MVANRSTSKKRFVANSRSKLPERHVFFLDRSLGKWKVASALRQAGARVEVHDDHFPPDAPDETWLEVAGEKGWIVLTKDRNIRYRKREVTTVLAHGVRAFVLTAKDLTGEEMGAVFVTALPKIRKFLVKHRGPFLAAVTRGGTLRMVLHASSS